MKPKNRRKPRVYIEAHLDKKVTELPPDRAHYLRSVLRLKAGDELVVFNGCGTERRATIDSISRQRFAIRLGEAVSPLEEPRLHIKLLQALVKSEAMDLIVQKCAELGVREILPVATEFSVVKLDENRAKRRTRHWRKIAASACEQCGRHAPPLIHPPQLLSAALVDLEDDYVRIALHAGSGRALGHSEYAIRKDGRVALLLGPEGGLSVADLREATGARFETAELGPRILRAETATIAACSIVQSRWGDLTC